jgi:hypothetical protein
VSQFSAGKGICDMDHPPYSPDLAPANVCLSPELKRVCLKKSASRTLKILNNMRGGATGIPVQEFKTVLNNGRSAGNTVKDVEGDYFEKFYVANIWSSQNKTKTKLN